MSNLVIPPGAYRLAGRQAIVWSPSSHAGTSREHVLRVPLQDVTPAADPGVVGTRTSLDGTTREVFSVGNPIHEVEATIKFDHAPESLIQMLAAGARGDTLTFYPDVANAGQSYQVEQVEPAGRQVARLSEVRGIFQEFDVTFRFRKADGTAFGPELFSGLLFSYRAGWDLSRATFSRSDGGSAIATYTDIDGTLATAGAGLARDGHYVTDEDGNWVRSTKLEAARTNSITRSEEFDHADWTKEDASIVADDTEAPDGSTTADKIVEDATSARHGIYGSTYLTPGSAEQVAWSVFAKAAERDILRVEFGGTSYDDVAAWFDLSSGTVGTTNDPTTSASLDRTLIESLGGSWYRCTIVATSDGSTATALPRFGPADADGNASYSGDGSSGIYAWGAQLERAVAFPSSYIATTSSPVTRSVDSLSFPFNHDPQAGTMYAKWVDRGTSTINNARVAKVGADGFAGSARWYIAHNSLGQYAVGHRNDTGEVSTIAGAAVSVGDVVEFVGQLYSDGSVQGHISINGGSLTSATRTSANTLAGAWGASTINVNSAGGGTAVGFADFIALKIAPGVKTMAEMRAFAGEG